MWLPLIVARWVRLLQLRYCSATNPTELLSRVLTSVTMLAVTMCYNNHCFPLFWLFKKNYLKKETSLTPIHTTAVMQISLTYSEVWGNCKASLVSFAIDKQEMVYSSLIYDLCTVNFSFDLYYSRSTNIIIYREDFAQ